MVVFSGDMNGHIGSSNVGCDGTHGGFGYGMFQQFNPSIRSTLHRVTFAFVDWQYHT